MLDRSIHNMASDPKPIKLDFSVRFSKHETRIDEVINLDGVDDGKAGITIRIQPSGAEWTVEWEKRLSETVESSHNDLAKGEGMFRATTIKLLRAGGGYTDRVAGDIMAQVKKWEMYLVGEIDLMKWVVDADEAVRALEDEVLGV